MKFQKLYLLIILCLFSNVSWSDKCVQGDCKNGLGTYLWDRGDKYVGEWKMQNMHGFGIGTWPNGDRYEGDWVNGQRTGQGKYFYSGGGVYTGEWKNNNRHGEGTMIWTRTGGLRDRVTKHKIPLYDQYLTAGKHVKAKLPMEKSLSASVVYSLGVEASDFAGHGA